ncbi:GyrI-like domain-containing protein [Tahibacter caeni]|uniref:GyrI-like domain-containing protein n=1 Tax=Tahibacter caeni TaxID=1453545 RepID=UPI002148D71B|nr:GyrI-like domain-containing protein [Tahibacter caeni]
MIDVPQIVRSEPQQTAVIRFTVPREEMPRVMHAAIDELVGAITAQDAGPAGPMYTFHHRNPTDSFDLEVGFPVRKPVAPVGRVQPGQLPAATVARTVYRGPYEGLGQAWGEFMRWIEAGGRRSAGTLWERYVRGPESGADAATWETELNRPLLDD